MVRRIVFLLLMSSVGAATAQSLWQPTEVSLSSGMWVAEEGMRDQVEGPALGLKTGWMRQASNGWAAYFGGIEHGPFLGVHRIGATGYGWQAQAGWTLRTRQTRVVGWSFSTGLAYNPAIYHVDDSPQLEAVGSHLNGLIRLGITVANESRLGVGLGILHTSNGALRRPNKGINTPQANLVFRFVDPPRRGVFLDGVPAGSIRSNMALAVGGRDHGAYGGHVYGVLETFLQSTYHWSPKYGIAGQVSLVHHGALRADPMTDAPSDSLASNVFARLQPGLSAGWSWTFGRARLDLLKGGVLANPTPGFVKGYNKAQLFLALHPSVDVFVALRFTDWRADYASAGLALRWGSFKQDCTSCPSWR